MSWPSGRSLDGGLDRVPLPGPGSLWLCGKRVVGPDPDAALRRADDAGVIVCFNEHSDLEREYPAYLDWLAEHAGERALWFPVPDLHAPPMADAVVMVESMLDRLDGGAGLVLHCAGGLGRAPTMAVCVLVARGLDAADALDRVARHRPMAGPEAGAQQELIDGFAVAWGRR